LNLTALSIRFATRAAAAKLKLEKPVVSLRGSD
jgi:hypothetical protein